MKRVLVGIVALTALTACVPDTGAGGGSSGGNHVTCSILRPSAPYGVKGPNPGGANFYKFTVRADGEVICSGGPAAEISVTVVLHYSTNGESGATVGRTTICHDKRECASFADYERQRLYCKEVYHYADYGQVTAWYSVAGLGQTTVPSRESPHRLGDSYNPREAGCH